MSLNITLSFGIGIKLHNHIIAEKLYKFPFLVLLYRSLQRRTLICRSVFRMEWINIYLVNNIKVPKK